MQCMVIFLGLGQDAVNGRISGVRSECSRWSYFLLFLVIQVMFHNMSLYRCLNH